MPKRTDLKTILIIGSGPIVIGQGCEFDYSGTQACKALREEGYQVVLVNSNPATIMTDPQFSDRTYIEPITPEAVAKIIEKEMDGPYHIDALLPTLGGQTALNCACKLFDEGVLDKYGVEMIGATREVIYRAEDRELFDQTMTSIGLKTARHGIAHNMDEAWGVLEEVGLPAIIRPAFTLGGSGGGIAYNRQEFEDIVRRGLDASMTNQVLIDQSLIGWKEYELEVMRDRDDNVVIICSIENIDAMGVHTGDSITVAPAQTLTDREYQRMRDASLAIIRAIGVETGGSNIQFAINPAPGSDDEPMIVVEMNPRVSRSSALASKATGFPIAKIAAKLAVGYTLWELPNDITGKTVACFEPTIDYVVTKIPRWTFEKFPEADETLTTQMKSVGEAMSIGRTFKESFQKGIRSMEVKRFGYGLDNNDKWLNCLRATVEYLRRDHLDELLNIQQLADECTPLQAAALLIGDVGVRSEVSADVAREIDAIAEKLRGSQPTVIEAVKDAQITLDAPIEWPIAKDKLRRKLSSPSQGRPYYLRYAMKLGLDTEEIYEQTGIDPWFLDQFRQLVDFERVLLGYEKLRDIPREVLFQAKQMGYSDMQLARLYMGKISSDTILKVRKHRKSLGVTPVYKLVDTCAAEFEAATPYYYSTYEAPIARVALPASAQDTEEAGEAESFSAVCYLGEVGAPPVYYTDDEIRVSDKKKIVILGGGPNRIGQGIEFDYCCVQAAFAAKEMGYEAVMVNSNPETVSTDYDTSDLLFFEPLTLEDVLNIYDRLGVPGEGEGPRAKGQGPREEEDRLAATQRGAIVGEDTAGQAGSGGRGTQAVGTDTGLVAEEQARGPRPSALGPSASLIHGVIVQFGGQTPLNLAHGLEAAGVPIIGTSVASIDLAEDREQFTDLLRRLDIKQPAGGIAHNVDQAIEVANKIGYPVLVRPSFVLGGRAMETVFDDEQLRHYMALAMGASDREDQPILIDDFLAEAIECDVDVLADYGGEPRRADAPPEASPDGSGSTRAGSQALVCGVMEHIEEAGIHSGDSACAVPAHSLPQEVVERVKAQSRAIAQALKVRGLMNVQYAIRRNKELDAGDPAAYEIFVLEVNPRASRTVPFVSKATGVPWARIAAKVMAGCSLNELGVVDEVTPRHTSVKESVFPFSKFPGVDVILGPEMRSTGEVMGIDPGFPIAFAKAQMAAGVMLPTQGTVFLSVRDSDKPAVVDIARRLLAMGFTVRTTSGVYRFLKERGVQTQRISKISEGRPNAEDLIMNRELQLILNTPTRKGIATDEGRLRSTAVRFNVPMITTITGAAAAVQAIEALRAGKWTVRALQDYFAE